MYSSRSDLETKPHKPVDWLKLTVQGGEEPARHSPKHTVSCERITVSRAVARAAAVLVEAPVSHHAAVAVGSSHSRFADAVSGGGVADRAVKVGGQGTQRVAVACWGLKKDIED